MPNWVHHHLTITGPEIERERFIAECFSDNDETDFDFNKLIPEPEHIKDEGSTPYSGDAKFPPWYDWRCKWRCKNWSTKWNAYRTEVVREGEAIWLSFDTAWAPPVPIFNEVARRFPNLQDRKVFNRCNVSLRRQHSLPKRQCRVRG